MRFYVLQGPDGRYLHDNKNQLTRYIKDAYWSATPKVEYDYRYLVNLKPQLVEIEIKNEDEIPGIGRTPTPRL